MSQNSSQGGSRAAKKRRMKNPKPIKEVSVVAELHDDDSGLQEEQQCIESIGSRKLMDMLNADDLSCKVRSQSALQYFLHPTTISEFESHFFDNQPLLCKREDASHFEGLFSKSAFEKIINQNVLNLGTHINVTKYKSNALMLLKKSGGKKDKEDTFNFVNENDYEVTEEAFELTSSLIWQHAKKGNVLQLLCPEKYSDSIWKYVSYLEGFVNAKVYCQAYFIPAGEVGYGLRSFSTDRYIVQCEGISSLEIYKPSSDSGLLPRESNTSIVTTDYINSGSVNTELKPGDSVYIPKGWIHQLKSCSGEPSVSVHMLTNEHNSIADLVDIALPQALSLTIAESLDFRRALPRNIGEFFGVSAAVQEDDLSDEEEEDQVDEAGNPVATAASAAEKQRNAALLRVRQQFKKKVTQLLHKVVDETVDMLDASVDQIMKGLVGSRLPPALTEAEEERTKFGSQPRRIGPMTKLCAVRPNVARVCVEDDVVVLYHCLDNGREVFSNPLGPMEYDLDDGPAIEKLLTTLYVPPAAAKEEDGADVDVEDEASCGVMVIDLPHTSEEVHDKVGVAESLYNEGLLMVVDEDGPGVSHRLAGAAPKQKTPTQDQGGRKSKDQVKSLDGSAVAELLLESYNSDKSKKATEALSILGEEEDKPKKTKKRSTGGDKAMDKFLAGVNKRAEDSRKKNKITEDDEECPF